MKRFTKVSLITAAGLFIAGCLLGSISALAGGGSVLRNRNRERTESVLDGIGGAVYRATDGRLGYLKTPENGASSGRTEGGAGRGDQIELADIRKIEMELGAGSFYVAEKDEDDGLIDIYIEEAEGHCSYEVKHGTLHISGFQNIRNGLEGMTGMKDNLVEVRVPKGSYFEEIDLDIGACRMDISRINAGKLDVTLGAAEVYLTEMELNELEADVGAGRIEASDVRTVKGDISVGVGECVYNGTISGNLDADCGMGNMEFSLTGRETDHDYEIECSMGNVDIGDYSAAGFMGSERHIDNHAGSKFEIECDMGNVTISFEE